MCEVGGERQSVMCASDGEGSGASGVSSCDGSDDRSDGGGSGVDSGDGRSLRKLAWCKCVLLISVTCHVSCFPWSVSSACHLSLSDSQGSLAPYAGVDAGQYLSLLHAPTRANNDFYTLEDIEANGTALQGEHINVLVAVKKVFLCAFTYDILDICLTVNKICLMFVLLFTY